MARRTRWIDALIDVTVASAGQQTQTLFPGVGPSELNGGTIVRTIGRLFLGSATVAGAYGIGSVDIGLGVISQEAIGAGVFPDPNDADNYPVRGWLHKERIGVWQNGSGAPILANTRFDAKSQRKLDTGAFYLIVNHVLLVGTSFSCRVFGSVRTLILLP